MQRIELEQWAETFSFLGHMASAARNKKPVSEGDRKRLKGIAMQGNILAQIVYGKNWDKEEV